MQPTVDAGGNALLWNGEVFGGRLGPAGMAVPGPEENDTDAVLAALGAWDLRADDGERRDAEAVAQHVRYS